MFPMMWYKHMIRNTTVVPPVGASAHPEMDYCGEIVNQGAVLGPSLSMTMN